MAAARREARSFDTVLAESATSVCQRWHEPARAARREQLPASLLPRVDAALRGAGITSIYPHQRRFLREAGRGGSVAVVSPTASGKTLAYMLVVADRLARDPHARALYVSPTKALAHDQARAMRTLGLSGVIRPATYDADTDPKARSAARRHANLLLTNPDMLHASVIPRGDRFGDWFLNLAFVIIDEAHVYRGVFGSHVAHVLRRLRRVCAAVGCEPQFLLASATIRNADEAFQRLVGEHVRVVETSDAPRAGRTVVIVNPPLLDAATGRRASALEEAAVEVAALLRHDARVICFARTRRAVEVVAARVRVLLADAPALAAAVAPYRAGYTPEQRRDLESRLATGTLRAVIATSALELGIDIGRLDCALTIGFPGTIASLNQQWGRAGRQGEGLAVLIASADPIDQYFARQPHALRDPAEAVMLDPAAEEVRASHLACAAFEAPIRVSDDAVLGAGAYAQARRLCDQVDDLDATSAGVVYHGHASPARSAPLRNAASDSILIVAESTGHLLGRLDAPSAYRSVHAGAVYLHLGEAYRVSELNLAERVALVEPHTDGYYTQAQTSTQTRVEAVLAERRIAGVPVLFGRVRVTERVVAYQRRSTTTGEVIDRRALNLPEHSFATQAVWCGLRAAYLARIPEPLGALHAAEHALVSVLPLRAMCDRGDVNGLAVLTDALTGQPTIYVFEVAPGGAGLCRQAYACFDELLSDARSVIAGCPCQAGCPSCVHSPRCGKLNEPLSKRGALRLLGRIARPC